MFLYILVVLKDFPLILCLSIYFVITICILNFLLYTTIFSKKRKSLTISMDYLFFLCSFHWNVGSVLCLMIYNKRICLSENPCHHISVCMDICVVIFQLSHISVTRHFSLLCLWLGLHQWKGASLSDKIMHLLPLMFPCFTNRSCPHVTKFVSLSLIPWQVRACKRL